MADKQRDIDGGMKRQIDAEKQRIYNRSKEVKERAAEEKEEDTLLKRFF